MLNWVSPSTLSGTVQDSQATLMSQCLHSNQKSMGLVLMPMFTYKMGTLWIVEHGCLKALNQRGINIDKTRGLVFKEKKTNGIFDPSCTLAASCLHRGSK